MIDFIALTRFRGAIDFVLKLMSAHGVVGKIRRIDTTPSSLILHMEDGSHWKVGVVIKKIDGTPLREDYAT